MTTRYALRDAVRHLGVGETTAFPEGVRESIPTGCLLDVLDMVPTRAGPGAATATMRIDEHHLNQSGVTQGGAIVALADAVAGWATYGLLDEGRTFTTLEFKSNLLRPARPGDELVATARTIHAGRTTCVLEVDVAQLDQNGAAGKRVAWFGCTQMIMEVS